MKTVRAIRATDEPAYLDILDRTSGDDRYYRFFRAVDHFDHADVARFVEPTPGVVGMISLEGSRGLGVAHAFFTAESAEIALVVAADSQRRGVGHLLIEAILGELRELGVATVTAVSLWENLGFAALARSFGMVATHAPGDGSVVHWRLLLGTPKPVAPQGHATMPLWPAASATPASNAPAA